MSRSQPLVGVKAARQPCCNVFGQVYLHAYAGLEKNSSHVCLDDAAFPSNQDTSECAFPLSALQHFCNLLDDALETHCDKKIAIRVTPDRKSVNRVMCLLGCYMIIKLNKATQDVEATLQPVLEYANSDENSAFDCAVLDCWSGLSKARALGWIDFGHQIVPSTFGQELLPGKFVCMGGFDQLSHPDLQALHVDLRREFEVQAIVSVDDEHDSLRFSADLGFAVAGLRFGEGAACPPADVAMKFLVLAEAIPGAVAVHCASDPGRAATLVALFMMKHADMTAGEAIGWLRLVQPGGLGAEQERFLRSKEALMRFCGNRFRRDAAAAAAAAAAEASAHCAVEEVGAANVQRFIDERIRSLDLHVQVLRAAEGAEGAAARATCLRAARKAAAILHHAR